MGARRIGPLLIIGGGENKEHHPEILHRFVELVHASQRGNKVGIVTTATHHDAESFQTYQEALARLGVDRVIHMAVMRRQDAHRPWEAMLAELGGIFFSGGDQLRVTSILGGSPLHRGLIEAHYRGLVVAGTSAGASMMSHVMIVEGEAREAPTRNTVKMAIGMGLWNGAVIDQHFSQRGRLGRLLAAIAQNPEILGVGLDENTAVEVHLDDHQLQVWGASTVTILDGRAVTDTNASESSPDQPLAVSGVTLHVLPKGYGFDLRERRVLQRATPAMEKGG